MKFSIITIACNGERYIAETIRTVLAQDYHLFEYIIIDGGSTDGTLDIVKGFAATDPRLRWVSEPDNGISDAMNKGIELSTGDVIAHLHSDDIYEPETLVIVARAFCQNPNALWAVGGYHLIDGNGKRFFSKKAKIEITFDRLLEKNLVPHPSAFVKKECYQLSGLFDLKLKYAMDYDFFLRLCRIAPPIMIAEYLSSFRVHPGSVSTASEISAYKEENQIRMRVADEKPHLYRVYLRLRYYFHLVKMNSGLHNARKRIVSRLGLCR